MRLLVAAACLGPCRLATSWCARPHRRPLQPLPFMVLRPLKGAGYARTRLIWTVRVSPSPPGYASDSACPFPLRRQTFDFIPAQNPTIVYLPGLEQNRLGTTAFALQTWAKRNRQGFFTADYFGCGKSEGEYADATISRWVEDAVELVEQEIKGPVVLVGSGVDEVYVVAPMLSFADDEPVGFLTRVERQWRHRVTRRCMNEVNEVEAEGAQVHVLGPGLEDLQAMGANIMDTSRRVGVMETSLRTSRRAWEGGTPGSFAATG